MSQHTQTGTQTASIPCDDNGDAIPTAQGYAACDDTCGRTWALYTRAAWDAGLVYVPRRYARGPGAAYADDCYVRVTRTRVLVTQWRGLDI